ncbi:macrophage-expressed gene 1 protein-like [Gouania willdenowi]|uniref:Macrophage-expressed gene 1 protein n=1 Tax=Gouania willdenowi TaxID=441366 RepID=A0A8C5G1Z9_GOUWI|nr:macrophage-expressed gene 1 protein-like [Gouania willdenowi]
MLKTPLTLLALSLLHVCAPVPIDRPTNWLRQCRASTNLSITALEVLPGGGWDNLRNLDMGRVMNLSYFQCQTTEDGRYLIPDEVFVIPQKQTGVETSSEIIRSFLEQKSVTSNTINADMSFKSVLNGKFSTENMRMKTHQVKDSSTTTRVQVRNFIYTVKAYPDFRLDARFATLAVEIADAIETNQTKYADYLSEKMVVDYGTHVIISVDAGATLVQEDYLSSSYVSDDASQTSIVKASAGINFFNILKFDIGSGSSQKSSSLQTYESNIQYSLIQSHGATPFYPGITLQKWQESIQNNLVAIDRSGVPLDYVINVNTLPDLPPSTVSKVSSKVSEAIKRYYRINTRPGCVDINSKNFNFQANVDDKSCEGPATNLSFGGVYQQCVNLSPDADPLCEPLAQKNPDTGDFSCRPPYTPTLLRSEVRKQAYTKNDCFEQSYACGFLWLRTCYKTVCMTNVYVRSARVDTYWCSVNGKAPAFSGFLFGGFYTSNNENPVTKAKNCPSNFIPVKFLSDGQVICVSNDYEMATRDAIQFGGLFSCQANNPLANNQRRCPPNFSQHMATISDGCEILYCIKSGLFTGGDLKPIHLPPFTRSPPLATLSNNSALVMTDGDTSWIKLGQTKKWKLATPEEVGEFMLKLHPEMKPMTSGEKAGIAFGVIIGLMVVVAVVLVRRRRKQGRAQIPVHYQDNSGTGENQRLMDEA